MVRESGGRSRAPESFSQGMGLCVTESEMAALLFPDAAISSTCSITAQTSVEPSFGGAVTVFSTMQLVAQAALSR